MGLCCSGTKKERDLSKIDFKNGKLKLYDEKNENKFANWIKAEPDAQVKMNVEGGALGRPPTV